MSTTTVPKIGSSEVFEQNGRFYIKTFLLDSSVNLNDWGVSRETLDENINSFIGMPGVVYINDGTERDASRRVIGEFDHPDIDDENVNHVIANQEPYRVTNIIDIVKQGSAYYAIHETEDKEVATAFASAKIPPFVSPAIYPLGAGQPENDIKYWRGIHVAFVGDPAFGVKKAQVTSTCSGDRAQCLMQLRKARIEKHGHTCGFCKASAMKAYFAKLIIKNEGNSSTSSQEHDKQISQASMEPNPAPQFDASKFVSKEDYQKLEAENAVLKQANESLKKSSEETIARVAQLEKESRKSKIASIVTAEVIKDEKTREETIATLTALNLKDEEFNKAVAPLLEAARIKVASRQTGGSKFTYTGSNDNGSAPYLGAFVEADD